MTSIWDPGRGIGRLQERLLHALRGLRPRGESDGSHGPADLYSLRRDGREREGSGLGAAGKDEGRRMVLPGPGATRDIVDGHENKVVRAMEREAPEERW